MGDIQSDRIWISEELERLIAVLPSLLDLPPDHQARAAWMSWKKNLLWQIRDLERREREIQGEPHLWIELSREAAESAVFGNAESRDTPADL